jgi:hypothetical protein
MGQRTRPEAEGAVLAAVDALFDAMRAADSAAARAAFHPSVTTLASTADRHGTAHVRFVDLEEFLGSLASAEPGALDERIGDAEIRIDDNLATVTTPFAFYLNGKLSHCGVNVFQVGRTGDEWKIIGLADTQRREGCEEWLK